MLSPTTGSITFIAARRMPSFRDDFATIGVFSRPRKHVIDIGRIMPPHFVGKASEQSSSVAMRDARGAARWPGERAIADIVSYSPCHGICQNNASGDKRTADARARGETKMAG